jgi:hypothetical protein
MATYLPGVTDYIPQIQPFKPDYNFYSNILQTKEAQYQAGYEKLSNIYGTLLNSEMLRSNNIERRANFFNKIDNDIKKIAGLDLSKAQNIDAAKRVFQPLIDDKYIQKDMAFTKVWRGQQSRGQALKNCTDPDKCGGEWWEGGDRALNYQAEDFVKAGDDESLSFTNPEYTPYINTYQKAMKFAKDMGFDTKLVTFSPDNRFIITTKNGPQVIDNLTSAFIKANMNDPKAMAMYNTQAYLERKDTIKQTAEQFGSEEAAEMNYLNTSLKQINEQQQKLLKQAEASEKSVANQKSIAENSAKKTPINEALDQNFLQYLENLNGQAEDAIAAKDVATSALQNTQNAENLDLQTMRFRVDSAKARSIFFDDMQGAATDYAMNTMEQEIDINKYALAEFEHSLKMDELKTKAMYDLQLAEYKASLKKKEEEEEEEDTLSFNEEGIPVEAGAGGISAVKASEMAEQSVKSKTDAYALTTQAKSQFVLNKLNGVINDPNRTPEEKATAQMVKDDLMAKAEVVSREGQSTYNRFQDNWFDPFSFFGGIETYVRSTFSDTAEETITQKGYLNADGSLVDFTKNADATNPNSPYNLENLNNKLDSFISTDGNGLFRDDATFKTKASEINSQVTTAKTLKDSALKKITSDNLKIRPYLSPGRELIIDDNGRKRSRDEFVQAYIQKYEPGLIESDASGIAETGTIGLFTTAGATGGATVGGVGALPGAAAGFLIGSLYNLVIDDADDIYEDAVEQYDEIYNSGTVSGLGVGFETIDGKVGAVGATSNRMFSFDPASKGPLKNVIKDLYIKDIAPSLRNIGTKNAYFGFGNASDYVGADLSNSNDNAKNIMADILRDSFQTKWKKSNDNRPLFEITRVGLANGDPSKVGITVTLDDSYIEKHKGKDNTGLTGYMNSQGIKDISLILDRDKAESQFFKSVEQSPVEFLLQNEGRVDITGYEEFGGTGSITRNLNNEYDFTLGTKYWNPETNSWGVYSQQQTIPSLDVNSMYERMNMMLAATYQQNVNDRRNATATENE